MITRFGSKAWHFSRTASSKAMTESAAPPPSRNDPFQVLDDVCIRAIFMLLSPTEIVLCEAVSRLWSAMAKFHLTGYVIRRDFPYAWETARFAGMDDEEKMKEFKRLAFEDEAIRLGRATWAYNFPSAQVHSIAGDYVVWHKQGEDFLQWLVLAGEGQTGRQVGKTHWLAVSKLVQTAGPVKIETLHVNEDGVLHVMMWVRDSMYLYGAGRTYEELARRNVVYSLRADKMLWADTCALLPRPMIPLMISKTHVYYLALTKTPDPTDPSWLPPLRATTSLVACSLRTRKLLYSAHFLDVSPDHIRTTDFKFLGLQNCDYLIYLGLEVQSNPELPDPVNEFAVIDAAMGNTIQRITYAGIRGQNVFAKPNSNTFALWSHIYGYMAPAESGLAHFGLINVYSLQTNGKFALTELIAVEAPGTGSYYAIHPFALYGFRMFTAFSTLTLEKYFDGSDGSAFFDLGGGRKSHISAKYMISEFEIVTLPPKRTEVAGGGEVEGEGGRRPCKVHVRASDHDYWQSLVMMDERRVVFLDRNPPAQLWVFYFGPAW